MNYDEFGRELPDPTPVAATVKMAHKVSTLDEMRRFYGLLRREAESAGLETPEEADDFDVDEDPEPQSPYEHDFDNLPVADLVQSPPVATGSPVAPAPGPGPGGGAPSGSPPVAGPAPSPGTPQSS